MCIRVRVASRVLLCSCAPCEGWGEPYRTVTPRYMRTEPFFLGRTLCKRSLYAPVLSGFKRLLTLYSTLPNAPSRNVAPPFRLNSYLEALLIPPSYVHISILTLPHLPSTPVGMPSSRPMPSLATRH
jgi:hypothetical protein